MLVLFLRTILLYVLVFVVLRLMGKRQLNDLQPFDLVVTLLMAELVTEPITDPAIPLLYGLVPIVAIYLMQQLVSYLSLKSERVRAAVCGKSIIVIEKGVVQEDAMRKARYTLNDLFEQLRDKDVFDIARVEYAILETNGNLSILLKGPMHTPSLQDLQLPAPAAMPCYMLILDGKVHDRVLRESGHSMQWLSMQLKKMGFYSAKDVFFASLAADGTLHVQGKQNRGGQPHFMKTGGGRNA